MFRLNDMFNLFDVFQQSLYSNDPEIIAANVKEDMSERKDANGMDAS